MLLPMFLPMLLSMPLTNWWLELEVTPVTIDGLTVGNLEFSHKSYKSVPGVPVAGALLDNFLVTLYRLLCITLACLKFSID